MKQKTTRAKKGSLIIKSPKTKQYNLFRCYNTNSKTIFGILDGDIGYMKSSDINIMDKLSTGSQITKKNIEDIFVVSRLKDITKIEIPKEETHVEEIKEENKITSKSFNPFNNIEETPKDIKTSNSKFEKSFIEN